MPQPEMAFANSPFLTNVGLNMLNTITDYAAQALLPIVPNAAPTGTYNIFNIGDFVRRNGKEIANYEAVPLGGFSTTEGTFSVKNWGVGTPYTARDLAAARTRGIPDQRFKNMKAKWVTTQGVLEMEFRVRDLFQTTANWSTTISGVTSAPSASQFIQWDQAAATPVDDILLWKRKLRLLSGFTPNTLILPELVLLALKKNAQLIARATPQFYGGNTPMEVSISDIEKLFGLKVFTPLAVYNSAAEGQTAVLADIWSNTMWLGYLEADPDLDKPSAAYNISWTGNTTNGLPANNEGGGAGPNMFGSSENEQGLFIREYPDLPRGAIVIEGMLWRAPVVVAASMGMTWTVPIP